MDEILFRTIELIMEHRFVAGIVLGIVMGYYIGHFVADWRNDSKKTF